METKKWAVIDWSKKPCLCFLEKENITNYGYNYTFTVLFQFCVHTLRHYSDYPKKEGENYQQTYNTLCDYEKNCARSTFATCLECNKNYKNQQMCNEGHDFTAGFPGNRIKKLLKEIINGRSSL